MRVIPYGAAGGVTGSCYLVETKRSKILIDCGLFQGFATSDSANRVPGGINPSELDAVVLTHAHLDHCGRLPLFVKAGFAKPIYATPATIDVAKLILLDSAHIQESDAVRMNRKRARALKKPLAPLYTTDDVKKVFPFFVPVDYETETIVMPGIKFKFVEAGHMLGSASVELFVNDVGVKKALMFSGDLGGDNMPILRDSKKISDVNFDAIFVESTYGDRDHRPYDATLNEFRQLLEGAIKHKGKVLIPTFAVGRAQQLLYHLGDFFARGVKKGGLEKIPVYLDSPMAIKASRLYKTHKELYDDAAANKTHQKLLKAGLSTLKICETGEESRALNDLEGPCIIMAGAGMCNGGRILHHFKNNLWKPSTVVLICGYQAEGTLGRLLAEGRKRLRIYGEEIGVAARVYTLGGFSAHAGQTDLLKWLAPLCEKKRKRPRVVVMHGETKPRLALSEKIHVRFGITAVRPALGEEIVL
ncbi:MAG: MBL fold metallo-hydrolase [Opitutae bacterium]|nr:MBL fold metallo-hydrolase [Opitutae bacterium]MCD8299456.1 MBL fold metallo-hydrolase [Opitutae bacterium]